MSKFGIKYFLGHKPEGIGLILTRRCNIDCSYCKIKDNSGRKKELTKEKWKKIIDKFVQNKHMHFIFTGGEPLLYKGVYELVDYTSKKAATSLITNSILLNNETFDKLKNLDFLTFSCDTNSKDGKMTKNTLNKFKFISQKSLELGIKPSTIITITSKNTHEVIPIIKEASKYNISILLSFIHSDQGDYDFRGYAPFLEFKSDKEFNELELLQRRLLQMKKEGYKISESDYFIKNMINYANGTFNTKCPATEPFFTIDCDGFIKPCHDIKASKINALEFEDYPEMKEKVSMMIPKKCSCYYDCYINKSDKKMDLIKRTLMR